MLVCDYLCCIKDSHKLRFNDSTSLLKRVKYVGNESYDLLHNISVLEHFLVIMVRIMEIFV